MRQSFKTNEKFRSLIEDISDGIIAIDQDWRIVYVNQTAEKMLQRDRGGLLEKDIWDEFPESVDGKFHKAYCQAMQSQNITVVEDFSNRLGKWTKATVYPSLNGLIIYFHDITTERKAEIRAEKTEADYKQFLDRITDGFIVLDEGFRYVYVNKKIGELLQRDPESLLGKNVWEEFPEAVNSTTYKAFETAFKEQRFISNIDYYDPLKLWQENYIYPSAEGLSVFVRDITDRKQLEKQLHEKERNQQFELMIATLEAQEKERTYIGQELHDNVNQLLVATRLILSIFRDDPAKVSRAMIDGCIQNLEKAIEENRRISHELVTPDLKEETLVEQLRLLLQTMLTANSVHATIEASGFTEFVLDQPRKLAIYRIAQEQCTNIIKHANARHVRVVLFSHTKKFTMIIKDDGRGMSAAKVAAGIGLRNIGARVGFFEGDMKINTKPGAGFTLEIQFPIAALPVGA